MISFDEAHSKLKTKPTTDCVKQIYEWVKTGVINFQTFSRLIVWYSYLTEFAAKDYDQLIVECDSMGIDTSNKNNKDMRDAIMAKVTF